MVRNIHRVSVIVRQIEQASPDVRVFTLMDKDDWELPPFTPGAHVDVHLPSGSIRQYSLCGDPRVANAYRIAVERDHSGRGGSREMHDSVEVGQELLLSLPRNTFPLVSSNPVVMIAGGIGITPFLPALYELNNAGRTYHLHYCVRTQHSATFAQWLDESNFMANVSLHISDQGSRLDLNQLVAQLDSDTHLYCCGPARMIEACETFSDSLGDRLHTERFSATCASDPAYKIILAPSGRVIPVAEGQTMLQALRAAGVEMPSSCEAGICLDCKCKWLEGNPVHRELTMPKEDRQQWITPCVSGSAGPEITLEL